MVLLAAVNVAASFPAKSCKAYASSNDDVGSVYVTVTVSPDVTVCAKLI